MAIRLQCDWTHKTNRADIGNLLSPFKGRVLEEILAEDSKCQWESLRDQLDLFTDMTTWSSDVIASCSP
jgi:hypothetical protein